MTADLPALLEELKEVEPLLWDKITYLDQGDRVIKFAYQVLDDFALDHLQGCIQRAIAANGWEYQIAYQPHTGPDDKHGHAYIWPIGSSTNCYESDSDTPAAAILAAYIQARKAMR